jgi:hypothetical protein
MNVRVWLLSVLLGLAAGGCRSRASNEACEGVPCSGHGRCVVVRQDPTCACNDGYRPEGLNCLPLDLPPARAAGPVQPPADPSAPPLEELSRLCTLALKALVRPEPGVPPDLATEAKRDAIGRETPKLVESCTGLVQTLGADRAAVGCAIDALGAAEQQDINLGTLGSRDPAAATCGETWSNLVEARADGFQQGLRQQRETFGVAVFGFHRQYGFRGGIGEEFCRRFVAAFPAAPPEILEPGGTMPDEWTARIASCAEAIDGFELKPLLRWCIVDRADEVLAARNAGPCERYATAEEKTGLQQLVNALVAIAPVPAPPPAR